VRGWRAYYADGARYSSADTAWQALPGEGLVGVVVYLDEPYRRILDGHDWIWLEDGAFRLVDTHPKWGKWAEKPAVRCASCLKRGAGMDNEAWAAVQAEMMAARVAP
jgi:hypothetical protein